MRKVMVDLMLACMSAAIFGIVCVYPQEIAGHKMLLAVSMVFIFLFFLLAARDYQNERREVAAAGMQKGNAEWFQRGMQEAGGINEVVLLSEDGTEVMAWDVYNKISLVIGRDVKENRVDIDLSHSPHASLVDVEHAVLNFAAGSWYVADLESQNGVYVEKAEDGKEYRISPEAPCRVEAGECIRIGLNRLLLR